MTISPPIAKAVIALALLTILTLARTQASPVTVSLFPERPIHSKSIEIATGTVVAYAFRTDPYEERLTIRDDLSKRDLTVLLSADTTVDGIPLKCADMALQLPQPLPAIQPCAKLPSYVHVGSSRVALLYWRDPTPNLLSSGFGADTILILK